MSLNKNLQAVKRGKNDNFYTQLLDIENKSQWKLKSVLSSIFSRLFWIVL